MKAFNFLFFSLALGLSSCTTYLISVESLKAQFSGIDSTKLRSVEVGGPLRTRYNYLANPMRTIKMVDKSGNQVEKVNKPSIEMRVTEINGRKTIFYFDRIFITDSTITGVRSRFASSIRRTINLSQISKIEVQDGKKNFYYISE